MTELEQIRLYLRDQGTSPRFSDEDIMHLYTVTGDSVYGATALGWLLVAGETTDGVVSASIGNTSESYGQPTEKYKAAMAMHHYWLAQIPGSDASAGLWLEIVPDYANGTGGIIAELLEYQDWLVDHWGSESPLPIF